jgi:hypothetical protein
MADSIGRVTTPTPSLEHSREVRRDPGRRGARPPVGAGEPRASNDEASPEGRPDDKTGTILDIRV